MIQQHLKIAWRSIKKTKALSAIQLTGLALAIAAATLLYLTAMFELSFDNFHKDREKIALLYTQSQTSKGLENNATMPGLLSPLLKKEMPEIAFASRYLNSGLVLRNGDKQFSANNKYVDSDFLHIFSFPMLEGNIQALDQLDNLVIDKAMALALFETTDVLGKSVEVNQEGVWSSKIITGVLAAIPKNSSITFNSLLRFELNPSFLSQAENWSNRNHSVFIKLADQQVNDAQFTQRSKSFMDLHFAKSQEELKRDGAIIDQNGSFLSLHALPLAQYHRNNLGLGQGNAPLFPWILLLIAGLVLIIACSNFINLSLANSFSRNREIGTRKTLGSSTRQLVAQLWTESFLISCIALFIGLALAWLLIPEYNALMNYQLRIGDLFTLKNLLFFSLAFILMTLLAGGYPAWRIAQRNILESLKGTARIKSSSLRNSLTILQFTVAIILMLATIIISFQLQYISNRPLGYNKSSVISIPMGEGINKQLALQQLRVALAAEPWVESVTASDINLGRGRDGSMSTSRFGYEFEGRRISTNFMRIDYDYLKTLDIKLIAGRDFDRNFAMDTTAIIINEQMAEQLGGTEKILGKTVDLEGNPQVIGVFDDFNFQDLRRKVEPLTLSINPAIFEIAYVFVRVNGEELAAQLNKVTHIWKKVNPKASIEASYLDENTQNMYAEEQRFVKIIISGAIIAIVISTLGLFALALLMINKRIKEIGIRKVLGSSVSSIVLLLSRDFIKLITIAFLLAAPLAWWLMHNWLDSFAYRIDMAWWMFAMAGLLTLAIALGTITWQTLRAARGNPINSLKDE